MKLLKVLSILLTVAVLSLVLIFKVDISQLDKVKEFISEQSSNFVISEQQEDLEIDEATVEKVVDGDTLLVKTSEGKEERVRLLLIDTPESVHPNEPVQKYGVESSDYAKSILKKGDVVSLEVGNPERDKYERLLAYVWIDKTNFNQLMVEQGFARVGYVYEPNTKYLNEFREAEQHAQKEKKNIWSIEGYVTEDGFDMSVVD